MRLIIKSIAFFSLVMIFGSCEPEQLPQEDSIQTQKKITPMADNGEESNPPPVRDKND